MRERGGRAGESMDVVNQPSASPFGGLVLKAARGSSIETPVPSSIPCPDNSGSISTAPLTVTGWWLVTTAVIWRALLKCQIRAGEKVVLLDISLGMDTADERIWLPATLLF